MSDTVELIIPSFDRFERLSETLLAIRRLYPLLPIRIALQGPDLRNELYRVMVGDPHFTIEYHETPGLIAALNSAFRNSNADVCIILDDDAVPCDGWLEAHLAALHKPNVSYTYGRVVEARAWRSALSDLMRIGAEFVLGAGLASEKKLCGRIVGWTNFLGFVFGNFYLPGDCVINAPAEGNFAIRRMTFLEFRGYNPEFRGNSWGYGPEFGMRLAKRGRFGLYVGDAIIIHRPHSSGGTRAASRRTWYRDYVNNNRILIASIGPWAWIGAIPRLIRRWVVV